MRLLRPLSPIALVLLAMPARAEEPAPAPVTPKETVAEWNAKFGAARERLLSGDFAECAEEMAALSASAPSETTKQLAAEEADLCRTWADKGFVFVKKTDLGESSIAAKARGIRTTDELAVLYTNAVLFGLGTGAWFDAVTEPQSSAGRILPALGLAGASAAVVAIADAHKPLKYGVPQSIVTGMYVGFYEGLTWTLWNQAHAKWYDEWKSETVATVIWGSAAFGALAGGVIGSARGTTPGRASYVGSAALWTGLVGGLLGAAFGSDRYDTQDDYALLTGAIALNVGVVGGMLTASSVSPSIARVRFLDLGGLAGGLVFGGLYAASADNHGNDRTAGAVTALGIGTGLAVAYFATTGMTPDRSPEEAANKQQTFVGSLTPGLAPSQGGGMATLSAIF